MAEMTIHLRCDPITGKKDIIVALRSDEDALPHEHEQQHKALVNKLIEGGVLTAEEVGKVVVEREQPQKQPATPAGASPEPQKQGAKQGQ